ncbi:unnamed protein product [Amoebophrya sp. A120]|nr:unnamed protein product [Amoebophrya sp. A120]|eukprot:GSA120T00022634001.1
MMTARQQRKALAKASCSNTLSFAMHAYLFAFHHLSYLISANKQFQRNRIDDPTTEEGQPASSGGTAGAVETGNAGTDVTLPHLRGSLYVDQAGVVPAGITNAIAVTQDGGQQGLDVSEYSGATAAGAEEAGATSAGAVLAAKLSALEIAPVDSSGAAPAPPSGPTTTSGDALQQSGPSFTADVAASEISTASAAPALDLRKIYTGSVEDLYAYEDLVVKSESDEGGPTAASEDRAKKQKDLDKKIAAAFVEGDRGEYVDKDKGIDGQ